MAGVEFDPEIVREQADGLYQDAGTALRNWILLATTSGFVAGAALGGPWSLLHLGATAVGVGGGFVVGRDRARRLKVEAQMLLCELKVEENTRAWIAQSRLALNKLTSAVDKLPVHEAARPADPVAATPAGSVAAPPAPAPAAPPPAEASSRPLVASRNAPTVTLDPADEHPTWAAAEQPKPSSTLDHCEYLIVTPADAPPAPTPPPVAAEVEVVYEADHDALDDDAYMREAVDEPEPAEGPVLLAASGGGSPVRTEHGVAPKRRRARRR